MSETGVCDGLVSRAPSPESLAAARQQPEPVVAGLGRVRSPGMIRGQITKG